MSYILTLIILLAAPLLGVTVRDVVARGLARYVVIRKWRETYHWATHGEYISKPTLREYISGQPPYMWKDRRSVLIKNADRQHQWVLNGDNRGFHGDYPPANLT